MAKQATAPDADQTSDTSPQVLLEQLQQQMVVATTDIASLKNELSSVKEHSAVLADANQSLSTELEEKAAELAQAEDLIEQLTGKLAAAEVSQAEGPVVVTHEKEQYRVLAPKFQHHGLDVDAHTLRQNPDLVRELVEGGSGLLQKVTPAA